MTVIGPRRGAWLMAVGRIGLGAAVLAAPEAITSRWLGEGHARLPVAGALARSVGARDIAIGVAILATLDDSVVGPRVQAACAGVDGVDALATVIARKHLPRAGVLGTVAIAGGAALTGLYFSRRLAHA